MSDEMRPSWIGIDAIRWVINDAPVPAELAWTLVVVAARCSADGTGSWQSIATIAEKTGKSDKQARRDIQALREAGLLLLGDQSLVEHLPPGQRPTVYDIPIWLSGKKPTKVSRNPSGLKADCTTPMDGTPPIYGTSPIDGPSTPPMDGSGTPPMHGSQRDPLKRSSEQSSSARSPLIARVVAATGADDDEAGRLLEKIKADNTIKKSLGAYLRGVSDADLRDLLATVRAAAAVGPSKPSWCGKCHEQTRIVNFESHGLPTFRCPTCHPLNVAA